MINWLKSTPGLLISFIAMMIVGFGFSIWMGAVGGTYLDTISSPQVAAEMIAGMTDDQRNTHFWVTVLLDSAYPLAYGAFFAGMALRFFPRWGKWLCLPAILTAVADFIENAVQAAALAGVDGGLAAKAALTPLKFGLLLTAAAIALIGLAWGVVKRLRAG